MIKRPILKVDGKLHIGFKADQYAAILLKQPHEKLNKKSVDPPLIQRSTIND